MSHDIWTRCVGDSDPPWRRMSFGVLRVVESQHAISTRKLVDSDDEQALLEQMVDRVKPPVIAGTKRLHYLLSTPFRYPPLRWGSRFGATDERGIFYGARTLATAFAEVAFYRFVFLAGTRAALAPLVTSLSSFRADITTRRGLDLTAGPFVAEAAAIASKVSYAQTQALGRAMRAAGVEAFVYASARDPEHGKNVGLFTSCFAKPEPVALRSWVSTTDRRRVEISEQNLLLRSRTGFAFERSAFEVHGRLPSPPS